ncbi:MAG: hypothetical protein ACK5JF_13415 [Oscillospiraceae bacterium]
MKHIVYLDTDYLNSYVAQINKGLPTIGKSEVGDKAEAATRESVQNGKSEVGANLGIFKIGTTLGDGEIVTTEGTTEFAQELMEKIFHDNAVDQFEEYLQEKKELKCQEDDLAVGDYIRLSATFDAIDLDYLATICEDKNAEKIATIAAMDSIKRMESEAFEKGNKISQATKKQVINEIKEGSFASIGRMVDAIKLIFPFTKIITTEECIIPLNEKFLREKISEINYKYGGKISILGKVTNIVEQKGCSSLIKKEFVAMSESINDVFNEFISEKRGYWVVTPITLFFE